MFKAKLEAAAGLQPIAFSQIRVREQSGVPHHSFNFIASDFLPVSSLCYYSYQKLNKKIQSKVWKGATSGL